LKEQCVIPPDANAAFVAAMEDVLQVYHRPHDPDRPVVCLDETSKQLIAETRVPIRTKPGPWPPVTASQFGLGAISPSVWTCTNALPCPVKAPFAVQG
jgi:hypothetical protein